MIYLFKIKNKSVLTKIHLKKYTLEWEVLLLIYNTYNTYK